MRTVLLVALVLIFGTLLYANDYEGCSQLHIAVIADDYRITRDLLIAGADVDEKDAKGYTALHHAVSKYESDSNIIDLLIVSGADLNARDNSGSTVLLSLVSGYRNSLLRRLLDAGADPNISNKSYSPLHLAAVITDDSYTISLLLDAGADKNAIDKRGRKPIYYAENNDELDDYIIDRLK